ncbi:MAG: extracellular solute-binding protein, partial [Sphingobacteriia bacterium]|nr:extracellular solute-binding protein [Sphingobacteriia bacterium]
MSNTTIYIEKESAYKRIQQDIKRQINSGTLENGAKLLSENELMRIYDTNLYHVRRALRDLKKEKILNSVPKVGVFVSGVKKEVQRAPSDLNVIKNDYSRQQCLLNFMPSNHQVEYTNIWQKISADFMEKYPFYHIESNPNYFQDTGNSPDVVEYGTLLIEKENMSLLNLKPFFLHDQRMSALLLNDFTMPLYYNAGMLIFNKTQMQKLNMSTPDYNTYDEQVEYLENVVASGQRNNCIIPGTRQTPILRMGKNMSLLIDAIINGKPAEKSIIAEFTPIFEKITAFWRKHRISPPNKYVELFDDFVAGNSLIFMGYNNDIVNLKQRDVRFEWGVYPFFDLDGNLFKVPLIGAISATTPYQVECIRFLSHVQSIKSQKQFAELGFIPTDEDALKFNPYLDSKKFKSITMHSSAVFFKNPQIRYLCMNIIDIELWNCILHGKPCAMALKDSIALGKAYLGRVADSGIIAPQKISMIG